MKTINQFSHRLACAGLLMAVLAFTSAVPTALAQPQMKGAQRLMKLQTTEDLQSVEAGDTIVMTCPKCKDVYAQTVDRSLKGMKLGELKNTPVHLCETCDTKVVTQGQGKQAKDTLVHTCKMCGSQEVSCYLMKKQGGTTKDTEEKK